MKIQIFSTVFAVMVLLCGCSSAKFTAYHMPEIIQGKGGTEHIVDDIDFWDKGDPGRKYKILGILTEGRKRHIPLGPLKRVASAFSAGDDRESDIAKAARKYGGDAVILVSKDQEPPDDGQVGNGSHRRFTIVLVKYVE